MNLAYRCYSCGQSYTITSSIYQCSCGGLFDIESATRPFSKEDIDRDEWSLLRYAKALPFDDHTYLKEISMGEGMTPLLPLDREIPNLLVKVEYLMPTLSFKDRGAALLIAKAKELGAKRVIQDSSGNAGHSIAAYAARGGMECHIYVPQQTSKKKIEEIKKHHAYAHIVDGAREDAAKEAIKAVEKGDAFYGSHVYNPFFYQGTKTFVYEIFEQLGGSLPYALFLPLGNGSLLLGAYYGCLDLLEGGMIDALPKLIGVQAKNCSPLFDAFQKKEKRPHKGQYKESIAEGIAIRDPKRGGQILEAIEASKGEIITAREEEILAAQKRLAERGFSVEPTAAVTFAGYRELCRNKKESWDTLAIIPLCGAGLKATKDLS